VDNRRRNVPLHKRATDSRLIAAVGIHIVDLAVFRKKLTDRLISTVFLPEEARYAGSRARRHESFAGRFAAKKAVLKALGCRDSGMITELNQVEVLRNSDSGEVSIRLHGDTAAAAAKMDVGTVRVSISHSGTVALAIVVLEHRQERKGLS
jgi:phosphopantetheine--protein transferase-like protein